MHSVEQKNLREWQIESQFQSLFQVNVIGSDLSVSPPLTSQATVFITIIRDQFPPRFTNLPGSINLQELFPINATVFTAKAEDDDLQGSIVYDLVGVFPCRSYFIIDQLSGQIVQRNSFQYDNQQLATYTVSKVIFSTNDTQIFVTKHFLKDA